MASNDMDGKCPCCRKPLPGEILLVACILNTDCCAVCVAQCIAVDRCGLIDDQEFWDKLDTFFLGFGRQRIIPGKKIQTPNTI